MIVAFEKLIQTHYGRILLNNAAMALRCKLLTPHQQRLALRALWNALDAMPKRYTPSSLKKKLFGQFKHRAFKFQVAGLEKPSDATYISAVVRFEFIRDLLTDIGYVEKSNRRVKNALAPGATEHALKGAADVINELSTEMDTLILKGAHNIFFVTSKEALASVETAAKAHSAQPCNSVRDVLGLCHIRPTSPAEPKPLFVFEARRPISEFPSKFRIARPTTIDGFDNPRFRQHWPPAVQRNSPDSGLTVFLKLGFDVGAPEWVATAISLKGNFTCRFLGYVDTMPVGSDLDFIKFLMKDNGQTLHEMADELSVAMS